MALPKDTTSILNLLVCRYVKTWTATCIFFSSKMTSKTLQSGWDKNVYFINFLIKMFIPGFSDHWWQSKAWTFPVSLIVGVYRACWIAAPLWLMRWTTLRLFIWTYEWSCVSPSWLWALLPVCLKQEKGVNVIRAHLCCVSDYEGPFLPCMWVDAFFCWFVCQRNSTIFGSLEQLPLRWLTVWSWENMRNFNIHPPKMSGK